ncbi:MAG TPA: TIGR03086 family metal-binding protein [Actinopolymorphaceae bacterium]|jgi:uncharacterized protein (TIGR03086 family)
MDIRELDRRVVDTTIRLVDAVTADQLTRPTPCAGWTLRHLIEHMIGQHNGFALAATGEPSDLAAWRPRPVGDDPSRAYAEAARLVLAAFAEEGVLERDFWLPEIRISAPFPARAAIGFHFLDNLVHGWDIARSVDSTVEYDDDVLAVGAALAAKVPDTPATRGPRSQFQPSVPVPENAPLLDRIVGMLGRRPDWQP